MPVEPRRIIDRFGPHLSSMTGVRLSTSVEPERLVKTHCCFCGQQCGIQLKVRDNEVIGFEPWEDFPFNRGMLCPKGVKRYLQGSHPDRLTTALQRDPSAASGFSPMAYDAAVRRVAAEIGRIQEAYGAGAVAVLGGARDRPLLAIRLDLLEPDGVGGDEVAVDPVVLDHELEDAGAHDEQALCRRCHQPFASVPMVRDLTIVERELGFT
jgi:hypothetical protein